MKHIIRLLCIVLSFFVFTVNVHAADFRAGDTVAIPEGTVVSGNFFVSGNDITINGDVTGDILCAGKNITITGSVGGDILCVGQAITVSGDVGGSVRTASQNLSIDGSVNRNVTSVGQNVGVTSGVGGDVFVGASQLVSNAAIAGSLYAGAEKIELNGTVDHDVNVSVESLNIGDAASIAGTLTYESQNDALIAGGSSIGSVSHTLPTKVRKGNMIPEKKDVGMELGRKIWGKVWSLIILIGLGILFVVLAPKKAMRIKEEMETQVGLSFAVGLFSIVAIPTILLILIVTIIGIPFAPLFILLVALCVLLARFGVALVIGSRVLTALHSGGKDNQMLQLVTGYLLTWLVFSIPIIGGILQMIFGVWGFGAVIRAYAPSKK
jgi:cytoskeletal protein CcmA (bactofilin family)